MVQGNVFVSSRIRVCMAPEERTLIDKDVFETRTFAWLPCRALREGGGGNNQEHKKKKRRAPQQQRHRVRNVAVEEIQSTFSRQRTHPLGDVRTI